VLVLVLVVEGAVGIDSSLILSKVIIGLFRALVRKSALSFEDEREHD
jgi:hypothetical protein